MKWIKWLLISLCLSGLILIIGSVIFFPVFMVNIGIPESTVYGIRNFFGLDQDKFFFPEPIALNDSKHHEVKPLDNSQIIKEMAEELIPVNLKSVAEKGKVLLSSEYKLSSEYTKYQKIIRDFGNHLRKELNNTGWQRTRSTSDCNAIVTGDLFIIREDNNIPPRNEEQRRVLFLFWTDNLETRTVLGATTNYGTPNISAASKTLANDFRENEHLSKDEKVLKVALINTGIDGRASDNLLVTASILEQMVNEETDLTFLDPRHTGEHDTQLKNALRNPNPTVPLDVAASSFSESTGASAVLIISELETHFYLELMGVPGLNTLATGMSDDRPFEITIDAQPTARVFIEMPNGQRELLGDTPQDLPPERIKTFKVKAGTKFILVRGGEERIYIHTHSAKIEEEWDLHTEDNTKKTYRREQQIEEELQVEDMGDEIKYLYTWWD